MRDTPAVVVAVVVVQQSPHPWLLGNTLNPKTAPKNILI
jgi:hypothetical protein